MFNHCANHMFELFKSAKYSQAIDTTFVTQHTLTWSMLTIFIAVVFVIAISICLMCGDSKEELEKRRRRRDKKKRVKAGSDSSQSSKRYRSKPKALWGKGMQSSSDLKNKESSNYFGEIDNHSGLNVPLLA